MNALRSLARVATDPALETAGGKLAARSVPTDDGSGCIRWQGAHTPSGYGHVSVGGKGRGVHIVAHEIWIGPVPEGHEVDHVASRGCRWRDCVNPAHLEAVTHAENMARMVRPTHCPKGHPYTPDNIRPGRRRPGAPSTTRQCRRCYNDRRRAWRARRG